MDAYDERAWNSPLRFNMHYDTMDEDENTLFELHTDCSLKANEKLKYPVHPSIFHITWLEIGSEELTEEPKRGWKI